MDFVQTDLLGLYVITPRVFSDHRGFFLESYSKRAFEQQGINADFVQDNHSKSYPKGVIRGLHFQLPPCAQSKLVRVTRGAALDVVVDLRTGSATFGRWRAFELTETNYRMLFIPRGFAHGFCTLVPDTEFMYKVDHQYSAAHDAGIRWDDPTLGITWPAEKPILSEKDQALPLFSEFHSPF